MVACSLLFVGEHDGKLSVGVTQESELLLGLHGWLQAIVSPLLGWLVPAVEPVQESVVRESESARCKAHASDLDLALVSGDLVLNVSFVWGKDSHFIELSGEFAQGVVLPVRVSDGAGSLVVDEVGSPGVVASDDLGQVGVALVSLSREGQHVISVLVVVVLAVQAQSARDSVILGVRLVSNLNSVLINHPGVRQTVGAMVPSKILKVTVSKMEGGEAKASVVSDVSVGSSHPGNSLAHALVLVGVVESDLKLLRRVKSGVGWVGDDEVPLVPGSDGSGSGVKGPQGGSSVEGGIVSHGHQPPSVVQFAKSLLLVPDHHSLAVLS